jgi:hypothetical protein
MDEFSLKTKFDPESNVSTQKRGAMIAAALEEWSSSRQSARVAAEMSKEPVQAALGRLAALSVPKEAPKDSTGQFVSSRVEQLLEIRAARTVVSIPVSRVNETLLLHHVWSTHAVWKVRFRLRLSVRNWLALSSLSWFHGVPFCCFRGVFTWVCAVPLIVLALIIASLIWLEEDAVVVLADGGAKTGSDGNKGTQTPEEPVESLLAFRANFMADEATKDPYGFSKMWYKQVVVGSFSGRTLGMICIALLDGCRLSVGRAPASCH